MKFRKKPVVIEAVQLLWKNWDEICDFCNVGKLSDGQPEGCYLDENNKPTKSCSDNDLGLLIPTLEGVMIASEMDWIIKGIKGEFYPCKPDIFEQTYERVE
jgi:hypothetical protein